MARGNRNRRAPEQPKGEARIEPAGLQPSEGMVGIRATREYDSTRTGYMTAGRRTMVPVDVARQIMEDHPDDCPIELTEYTVEEREEIEGSDDDGEGEGEEKDTESPENKALESPETK
jgi:hypothetical protein